MHHIESWVVHSISAAHGLCAQTHVETLYSMITSTNEHYRATLTTHIHPVLIRRVKILGSSSWTLSSQAKTRRSQRPPQIIRRGSGPALISIPTFYLFFTQCRRTSLPLRILCRYRSLIYALFIPKAQRMGNTGTWSSPPSTKTGAL